MLLPNDVVLLRQFVVGNLVPDPGFNEFQRADVSPRATSGDGRLDASDITQAQRYIAGIDPIQPAGGPITAIAGPPEADGGTFSPGTNRSRTMRVNSTNAATGSKVTVPIEFNGQGDEVAMSFTLHFDPSKLRSPVVTLSPDMSTSAVLTAGRNENGDLTVLIDSIGANASPSGWIVTVTFDVAADAPDGETYVTFGSDPTPSTVSDAEANLLSTNYESGTVTITGSNPVIVVVSGRVSTPDGRGLRNATVTITDSNNVIRTVTTSSFGFFSFDNVSTGVTYTIRISSRLFRYTPQTVQVNGNLTLPDFVGLE